jgi:hypothetical protein
VLFTITLHDGRIETVEGDAATVVGAHLLVLQYAVVILEPRELVVRRYAISSIRVWRPNGR